MPRIGVRYLELRGPRGGRRRVRLELFAPVRSGQDRACRYRIWGLPERPIIDRSITGIDDLQAIQLALKVMGAELYSQACFREGRLTFVGTGDLMLPRP